MELRDRAEKPHLRDRAAALLKIAAGQSAHAVAQAGLLRPRQPDTVSDWLNRYEAAGGPGEPFGRGAAAPQPMNLTDRTEPKMTSTRCCAVRPGATD
jgi:hypothetical protein